MPCNPLCDAVLQSKVIGGNVQYIYYKKNALIASSLGTGLRAKPMAGVTAIFMGAWRLAYVTDRFRSCANGKVSFRSMPKHAYLKFDLAWICY